MSASIQNPPPPRRAVGSGAWAILLVALVVCITLAEAVLLELGATFFSGGYNHPNLDTPAQVGGFFAASLAVDAFLVLALWLVAIPVFRRFSNSLLSCFVLVAFVSLAIPGVFDLLRYRLLTVLGRGVSLDNLFELGAGDASTMAAEIALQLEGMITLALLGLAALFLIAWALRRVSRRWPSAANHLTPAPRLSLLAAGCALAALAGAVVFLLPGDGPARIQTGLLAKPSGLLLVDLIRVTTDADRDGYGLLSRPPDSAPFDGAIHPFALDVPSNQIDENGLAGDHPPGFLPILAHRAPLGDALQRRHLLVIFLESFRADLLGARYEGREITPFLNRLAREGAHSENAWANTPSTVASRAQLFGGDVEWRRAGSTWVDDFKGRGYHAAHFSGQDDSLNGSAEYMGTDRTDTYYDARDDEALRTSRTSNPLSLQVSWKTLGKRVEDFLSEYDADTPLFLYVNIVDTHFPYDHDELDNPLGVTPIARRDITRERADEVRATYANAAANVDRAVERLVTAWWERMGPDGGILITADHAQSFYENGVLGHGQFLDDSHTRVPFIVWGIGGKWPEPVSLADVRALVRQNLPQAEEGKVPRAQFVPDPDRWIFQYASSLEQPRRIRLRGLDRSVAYTFASDQSQLEGSFEGIQEADEEDEAFQQRMTEWLIRNWEAQQLRANDRARGN